MTIYFDDGFDMNSSMTRLMELAASECIKAEGIDALDPERCAVSVSFAMKNEIQSMNKRYRGVDKVTDVLSFPQFDDVSKVPAEGEILLGDVILCIEVAMEQAKEFGHSQERELLYLFTHSILHLLGYDHMNDEGKSAMRVREEEVMRAIGLPEPK